MSQKSYIVCRAKSPPCITRCDEEVDTRTIEMAFVAVWSSSSSSSSSAIDVISCRCPEINSPPPLNPASSTECPIYWGWGWWIEGPSLFMSICCTILSISGLDENTSRYLSEQFVCKRFWYCMLIVSITSSATPGKFFNVLKQIVKYITNILHPHLLPFTRSQITGKHP